MNEHPLHKFVYCPKCGSNQFVEHNEKSKSCGNCKFVYYFNPSAATVAIIVNDNKEILVCKRGNEPAKGTLDLPGGFVDQFETGEEAVVREVNEETGLVVRKTTYLFSLPNEYLYSNFLVHTLDLFYLCEVEHTTEFKAMDDVDELYFIPISKLRVEDFGLASIRRGIERYINKKK